MLERRCVRDGSWGRAYIQRRLHQLCDVRVAWREGAPTRDLSRPWAIGNPAETDSRWYIYARPAVGNRLSRSAGGNRKDIRLSPLPRRKAAIISAIVKQHCWISRDED